MKAAEMVTLAAQTYTASIVNESSLGISSEAIQFCLEQFKPCTKKAKREKDKSQVHNTLGREKSWS